MRANFIKIIHKSSGFAVKLFFFSMIVAGCRNNPLDIDIDKLPENTTVRRFDADVAALDVQHLPVALAGLQKKYPDFYSFFTDDIMQWGEEGDSAVVVYYHIFATEKYHRYLFDTVNKVFGDFATEEKILKDAFKRYHYHLPSKTVPRIVTFVSEFGNQTATEDTLLAIGLDLFLGEKYPYYTSLTPPIPEYRIRRMSKHYLPPVAMLAWFDHEFGNLPPGPRFLDRIILEGKKLYYLDAMLPRTADSLRTGWTTEQLEWMHDNEVQMWTHYIEKKLLYSTDQELYSNYILDAPYTAAPDVPPGSAPRIGIYTGWLIVQEYMKQNKQVTLEQLLAEKDADKILKLSKYKP